MGRRHDPYKYRARPVTIDGVKYDSLTEGRMVKLLLHYGVEFTAHVKFDCFDRRGKPFVYFIDFIFMEPQKFAGVAKILDGVEVKGVITKKAILKMEGLEYCHGVKAHIVTEQMIAFWEAEGLYWRPGDF